MGWIFLLVLIGWPVLEIWVFLQVGDAIGILYAILLFVAAGAFGLWLLRAEGLSLLMRAQRQMNEGVAPVVEGFDALCLVLAGVLLLLPGFVTDIFALLLMLPPVRALLRSSLVRWVDVRTTRARTGPGMVIEGDFEDVTPDGRGDPRDTADKPRDHIVHRRD
jgi:UPF0716 protein FxsA